MRWSIFCQSWRSIFKSRLLQLFFATFFGILLLSHPIFAFAPPNQEIRGVWLTTNDTNTLLDQPKLEEAIAQLSRLNFNTVYPVVWNSGYALYPSAVAEKMGIQPFVHKGFQGQDPLTDLIAKAHNQGLLVLPWFEFGFMAPPTSELATKHPQWLTQKRDGTQTTISAAGEVVWLNPFHPEVQKFITSLVIEVMNLYDVDGIQFDDHLCLPSELGYDKYTVNLYKKETEKDPPANPKDEAWLKWRADKMTAYVSQLNQAIKAKKSNAIFSVSPNPYDTAYSAYLQDWLTWVRQDIIDELVVQVYRPDLASFVKQLERPEIQEARKKIPTGVGILTGLRNRPIEMEFIQEKVLAAKKYGLGISFFFYDSLWNYAPETVAERQEKFLALFPYPADRKLEIPKPPTTPTPEQPTENTTLIDNFTPYEPVETIVPVENNLPEQPAEIIIPVETATPNQPVENTTLIENSTPYQPPEDKPPVDEFEPYQPPEDLPPVEEFKPYNP
ncbi:glycoside hydrolase family 10 protein [Crocosphaera sp. XPORK-15E]|uniref:glycoside hydrolase family 10 protein n=1 Tax=Crocosphaera sp. XPORK-15E TaxID=3110247 RepID=UPI002B20045C|nr:glycoside hydrolase family 10 protein [Crocosphaera sp. XPORK-15E]MEA5533208.1 glycoside hydrolase family 10 protein [Crocosphaera sp. XPORK-15E]